MTDWERNYDWHVWEWETEMCRRNMEMHRLALTETEARLAANWAAARSFIRLDYLLIGIALLLIARIGN